MTAQHTSVFPTPNIVLFLKAPPLHTHVYLQHIQSSAWSKYLDRAWLLNSSWSAGSDHPGGADHSGISPRCRNRVTCGHRIWAKVTWACPGSAGSTHTWWTNHGSCFWPAESFCAWLQAKTGMVPVPTAAVLFYFGFDPDLWLSFLSCFSESWSTLRLKWSTDRERSSAC